MEITAKKKNPNAGGISDLKQINSLKNELFKSYYVT